MPVNPANFNYRRFTGSCRLLLVQVKRSYSDDNDQCMWQIVLYWMSSPVIRNLSNLLRAVSHLVSSALPNNYVRIRWHNRWLCLSCPKTTIERPSSVAFPQSTRWCYDALSLSFPIHLTCNYAGGRVAHCEVSRLYHCHRSQGRYYYMILTGGVKLENNANKTMGDVMKSAGLSGSANKLEDQRVLDHLLYW